MQNLRISSTSCLIHSRRGSLKTSAGVSLHFFDISGVKVCRVDRETFWHLQSLIVSDPVFASTGKKPQRPVQYQLAAFLCRAGGAVSGVKSASVICIAEGTVYDYAKRVCRAFRNIRSDHLAWPGVDRRAWLSKQMGAEGFPGCISIGDGSYIRVVDKPLVNGWAYWSRKKFYAVKSFSKLNLFNYTNSRLSVLNASHL